MVIINGVMPTNRMSAVFCHKRFLNSFAAVECLDYLVAQYDIVMKFENLISERKDWAHDSDDSKAKGTVTSY